MPSDRRPMTCYKCSKVTIAQSRTETLFFSTWPWSDLSRSAKVKLIMPAKPRPMTCYQCSRTGTLFQHMNLIWLFKVSKGRTDYAIWFAIRDVLLVFYSYYSAISHVNPVFQHMTLIWPFKFSKGQTEYASQAATNDLLSVFYSNYSAISYGNPVFSADDLDLTFLGQQRSN